VNAVLLDTGAIVASLDRSERYHHACIAAIAQTNLPLVTCEAVIAESCYLLQRLPGAPEAVLANVEAGMFQVPFTLSHSVKEVRELLRKYRDTTIDFADACLIQLATELRIADILTLDRDFNYYRWGRNTAFQLLIALDGP
jgi:predicted nucleic acid-binding protein